MWRRRSKKLNNTKTGEKHCNIRDISKMKEDEIILYKRLKSLFDQERQESGIINRKVSYLHFPANVWLIYLYKNFDFITKDNVTLINQLVYKLMRDSRPKYK